MQFSTDFNLPNWRACSPRSWSWLNFGISRKSSLLGDWKWVRRYFWWLEVWNGGRRTLIDWELSCWSYCCCSMKRKPISPKLLIRHKWKTKIFALLLVGFCFSTFLLMEAQYSRIGASSIFPLFVQKPKIAFLFLARNRLPLDLVWDEFFQVR